MQANSVVIQSKEEEKKMLLFPVLERVEELTGKMEFEMEIFKWKWDTGGKEREIGAALRGLESFKLAGKV